METLKSIFKWVLFPITIIGAILAFLRSKPGKIEVNTVEVDKKIENKQNEINKLDDEIKNLKVEDKSLEDELKYWEGEKK